VGTELRITRRLHVYDALELSGGPAFTGSAELRVGLFFGLSWVAIAATDD
jgi:hypothetical protein